MTRLEELFAREADQPGPPSRLTVDDVYSVGRRRRTRTLAVMSGSLAAAAAVLAVVLVTSVIAGGTAGPGASPGTPPPVTGSTSAGASVIRWADAPDADHLYALIVVCAGDADCRSVLKGSDDGGVTWTVRAEVSRSERIRAVDASTLVITTGGSRLVPTSPPALAAPRISRDGGRTWTAMDVSSTPVVQVPAGGYAVCEYPPAVEDCQLLVVDSIAARVSPLAEQPPPLDARSTVAFGYQSQLWLTGLDPDTGHSAVAFSVDSGQTWRTHVFDCQCSRPEVTPGGGTVFVRLSGVVAQTSPAPTAARPPRTFRTDDQGDGWQVVELATPGAAPTGQWNPEPIILADGTFVTQQHLSSPGPSRYWVLREGDWQPRERTGIPDAVGPGVRASGGGYLAYQIINDRFYLYRSADWFTWTRLTVH